MTKTLELKKRIAKLEDILFNIDMIDRWTDREYKLHAQYSQELRQAKMELAEMEDTDK